jgi:hypothetical protein
MLLKVNMNIRIPASKFTQIIITPVTANCAVIEIASFPQFLPQRK